MKGRAPKGRRRDVVYQFLFILTRLAASDETGFLATMNSMIDVAAARPYLRGCQTRRLRMRALSGLPCEDILRMVVTQIDLCCAANGHAATLHVQEAEVFGFYA